MRMSMRGFTRLTNAFSKKFENRCHALARYLFSIIFAASTRRLAHPPASAAGFVNRVMHMADVVGLIDARAAEMPMVRGPYKKKVYEISN
jgi:hypothetical protein